MLETLEIIHLFGDKTININLKKGINILIGNNGCGKTTVLDIIYLILDHKYSDLRTYKFEKITLKRKNLKVIITKTKKNLEIEEIISGHKYKRGLSNHWNIPLNDSSNKKLKINYGDYSLSDYKSLKIGDSEEINLESLLDKYFHKDSSVCYIPLARTYSFIGAQSKYTLEEVKKNIIKEFTRIAGQLDNLNDKLKKEIMMLPFKNNFNKRRNITETLEDLIRFDEASSKELELAFEELKIGRLDKIYVDEFVKKVLYAKKILEKYNYKEINQNKEKYNEFINNFFLNNRELVEIYFNGDKLKLCFEIIKLLSNNKTEKIIIRKKLNNLESSINEFFGENNKKIAISNNGNIEILKNDKNLIQLENLSSGEKQLITLFSCFVLNSRKDSKIFLIDEPELSLNISWQRKFCNILEQIENTNQYILATHSPSIIGEYKNSCIWIGD